jgi:uncharacterized C2H2 Zn-finger protein
MINGETCIVIILNHMESSILQNESNEEKRNLKQFQCIYCGKAYKNSRDLDTHVKKGHAEHYEPWKTLKQQLRYCEGIQFVEFLSEIHVDDIMKYADHECIPLCCEVPRYFHKTFR